jgi:hypothetical protein
MSLSFTDSGQVECVSPTFYLNLLEKIALFNDFNEDFYRLDAQGDHVVIVLG